MFFIPLVLFAAPTDPLAAPGAPLAQSAPAVQVQAAPGRDEIAARIDAIAREAVEKDGVPGLSIAVGRDGELWHSRGYGYADAKRGATASEDTIYAIGSLTRQFTAVAVLELVEAGKLALDDDLAKLLPGFPTQGRKITLQQMLADTSGIPGPARLAVPKLNTPKKTGPPVIGGGFGPRGAFEIEDPQKGPPVETAKSGAAEQELFARFRDVPFDFEPGAGYSSDSSNYLLLGLIVARASGRPFPEFVRAQLIQTAGLEHTDFCPRETRPAGFAEDCKQIVASESETESGIGGEAASPRSTQSLCSSVGDLFRWQCALDDRLLLGEKLSGLMVAPAPLGDGRTTSAGFATTLGKLGEERVQGHTGGIEGFAVRLAHYPDARVTIVVLANCGTADVEKIETSIARAMLGQLSPEIVDLALDAPTIERCRGVYQMATTRIRVFARDGKLWYEQPTQPAFQLLYQGQNVFVWSTDKDARVVFQGEGDGPATSFVLTRGGLMSTAKRME